MSGFLTYTTLLSFASATYTPIVIKNVTALGPQITVDSINVSRDGGHSTLVDGTIVWLFDDTECMDDTGSQLSFVSNTAARSSEPSKNVTAVSDFGVQSLGKNANGSPKQAILADTTVGTGGWVNFQPDELEFNQQMNGKERVAIWPGTPPTSISTTQAFLYAPLVYVDMKPQDPSKEYQGRGMTLITITAPSTGPVATRQGDIIIPGTQVGFGGFTALLGRKSLDAFSSQDDRERDVYLLGVTDSGLQLARSDINDLNMFSKYKFWDPQNLKFTSKPPRRDLIDNKMIYMPGTFSSGSIFFSPYFKTFIMIYFNKMVDSSFYIRYLNLQSPLSKDKPWIAGGINGKGIEAEDAEALIRYHWSEEQSLYASPPGKGGFNYAGSAHPEFFNRQYFAKSLYADTTPAKDRFNEWYGSGVVSQNDAKGQDGKFLLLSWTSQKVGGMDSGIYEIQLAVVEFDDIPTTDADAKPTTISSLPSAPSLSSSGKQGTNPEAQPTHTQSTHDAIVSVFHKLESGCAAGTLLGVRGLFVWRYIPALLAIAFST